MYCGSVFDASVVANGSGEHVEQEVPTSISIGLAALLERNVLPRAGRIIYGCMASYRSTRGTFEERRKKG